jgi:tagatose-1,6-bisphosphate aldolase
MKIHELFEDITPSELNYVEQIADAFWNKLGIDVKFTRHFMDRVNDPRNRTPITADELIQLFKKEYQMYGKDIAELGANAEAVMKDLISKINLPFVIAGSGKSKQLVTKTVMRKNNFKTPGAEYKV